MPRNQMYWHRPRAQWSGYSATTGAYQIALLTLIVLRLTGVITWSWLWVLSPLWISGILLALGVPLLIGLRWHSRRRARVWMDQLGPEWLTQFMAGKAGPDAPAADLGNRDEGGHGASPPNA
jgi:hypothetical protein